MKRPDFPLVWDEEDTWLLEQYSWHINGAGYVSAGGYRLFHRLVLKAVEGQEVHHLNHNKLDCRKENLTFTSHSENLRASWARKPLAQRLPRNSTTGIVGVSWDNKSNKWRAYTTHPMQVIGRTQDFFEACCLRKSWENLHGAC
jgi:hypothetical protein